MAKTGYQYRAIGISFILLFYILTVPTFSATVQPIKTLHSAIRQRTLPVKSPQILINSDSKPAYVVVKFKDECQVRLNGGVFISKTGASVSSVNNKIQTLPSDQVRRLFEGITQAALDQNKEVLSAKAKTELADMNGYYRIDVQSVSEAALLIDEFNALDIVEIAYYQPQPEIASFFSTSTAPNFQPNQDYREAAPVGVDADFANGLAGGDGSGVKIIDIEGAWRHSHVDLSAAAGSHIAGTIIADLAWRNHGTAVLGEMIANDDGQGVVGICPGASIGTVSIGSLSTEEALLIAAANLQAGDLILIELHAPGPHYNFQSRLDQLGYVCMEYWPATFNAIQYCWAKGIIVVEAGGNGAEDYDNSIYYGDLFDTTYRNSHAIIVGAGHPPVDVDNLQRESFSNYGERVNLQGYGSNVYSTGYGGLYSGGGMEDSFYTATFSGTSSASPIITGTVACLQGRYKALYGAPMTADQVRRLLVSTGTPQQGVLTAHIGPRPDLEAAIALFTAPPSIFTSPLFLDTTLNEGASAVVDIWLLNRNTTVAYDFSIIHNDSLARIATANWLVATPMSGTIPPLDSVNINVTLDATLIENRIDSYKGILEISWGPSGGPLDSLSLVPAFLKVPCSDTTYTSKASDDIGGPAYNWISARTLGFKLTNTSYYNAAGNPLDDGTSGPHQIGFQLPYFDSSYTQMYVGVNGAISFTNSNVNFGGYFGDLNFPNKDFTSIVSAFWSDLIFNTTQVPTSGIFIYRNAANDTTVVEWYKPGNFNLDNDTTTDFEIILTKDGNITFQYLEVGNGGLNITAAIGISQIECAAKNHYSDGLPGANVVGDLQAAQFKSKIWDYVWGGDCDASGAVNVLDLTFLVDFIFRGGPAPQPSVMGNANCDSADHNILDLTYLVDRIFRGGPPTCRFVLRH